MFFIFHVTFSHALKGGLFYFYHVVSQHIRNTVISLMLNLNIYIYMILSVLGDVKTKKSKKKEKKMPNWVYYAIKFSAYLYLKKSYF